MRISSVKKGTSVKEFAKMIRGRTTTKSFKRFSFYELDEEVVMTETIDVNDSVLRDWGKHSIFVSQFELNGATHTVVSYVMRRSSDISGYNPSASSGPWVIQTRTFRLVNDENQINLDDDQSDEVVREFFTTSVLHTMRALIDRPTEFKLSRGRKGHYERMKDEPSVITVSLSSPITRTVGSTIGGGWKMPEHEVRGHYRKYRSGKTVWIEGHKRGSPDVERKTNYKVIP